MSRIRVDISAIRHANYNVPGIVSKMNTTKKTIGSFKRRVPEEIMTRYSIRQRIEKVYTDIEELERKINALYDITNSCVSQYESAENENMSNANMFI